MSFASLLDKTMTIRRQGSVQSNGFGGKSGAWADAYTDVPCRMEQAKGEEITNVEEGSASLVADKRLWFEYGTDLRHNDEVVIDGVTYKVTVVDPDRASARHHGTALLVEVRS